MAEETNRALTAENREFLMELQKKILKDQGLHEMEYATLVNIIKRVDWSDVFSRSEFIATHLWNEEDVRTQLVDLGYEGSDEQVDEVISSGRLKHLEDCTDAEWGIIEYACSNTMGDIGAPKVYFDPFEDTPVSICGPQVRVDWYNADEGVNGDYNPDDPEDVNLLRFDVYRRIGHSRVEWDDWEEVEDASYCTRMPADTDQETLFRAAKYLYKRYSEVLDADPDRSVKKMGEELSWISPDDFKKEVQS